MNTAYDGPTYTTTEVVLFSLNGLLEREYAAVYELIDAMTDNEVRQVLPVLLTVVTRGLARLDKQQLSEWRDTGRQYLAQANPGRESA